MSGTILHLVRRAMTSFDNSPLDEAGHEEARLVLLEGEFELWSSMQPRDQRHSLQVLRRFDHLRPGARRGERAGALLHDIGKSASDLGWTGRVLATFLGARTNRFSSYLDHEAIGARMLQDVSEAETIALVGGSSTGGAADALRRADEI